CTTALACALLQPYHKSKKFSSLNDPRSSNDPLLKQVLHVWDHSFDTPNESFDEAMQIRELVKNSDIHLPYAWATLTCGFVSARQEKLGQAEGFISEAFGRFFLLD